MSPRHTAIADIISIPRQYIKDPRPRVPLPAHQASIIPRGAPPAVRYPLPRASSRGRRRPTSLIEPIIKINAGLRRIDVSRETVSRTPLASAYHDAPNHTVLPRSGKTAQSSTEAGINRAINRPYPSTCTPPHPLRPEPMLRLVIPMRAPPPSPPGLRSIVTSESFRRCSLRGSDSISDDNNQSTRAGNRLHSWNRLPARVDP